MAACSAPCPLHVLQGRPEVSVILALSIQQAACIRGEVAAAIADVRRGPVYTRALAYRRGGTVR